MNALRDIVRYAGMPVLLASAVWVTFALLGAGYSAAIVVPAMSVTAFLVLLGLERAVAFRADWNANDGQRFNDVCHSVFGTALGGTLGNIATQALVGVFASSVAGSGGGIWPTHWPIALQVVLVFLLADLGRYIQHRLMHTYSVLWRFHELHHATNVLNVFKTTRSHLVERFTQQIFLFGPVLLLGAGSEAVLPFVIVNSFLGAFDHSNVDFRLGPIEYVIMGPRAHRIHHSRDSIEGNRNFGTALLVWDWVFRTYQSPVTRSESEWQERFEIGIEGDRTPPGLFAQILDPFRSRRQPAAGSSSSANAAAGSADAG